MATIYSDQITGYGETVAYKAPCRVATTANIALSGLLTVDGVVLVADDRVLVKNQTAPSENGIWIANSGAWTRARDFDSKRDIARGTRTNVTDGTVNGGREYRILGNNPIIVGTDPITISETLSSDSGSNAAAAQAAADLALAVLADPNFVAVAGIADEIATVAGLAPDIPGIPANVTAAQLAETNAQKWATNPEDVEVTPGLFSAFHWYRKSLAIWTNLTNTVAGWIHGAGTKTVLVDADEFGLADSEWSWALSKVSWASIKAGIASATMTLTNKTLTNPTISGGAWTGGTDLAIADGGTGASTAATAFGNLKQAASATATGVVELATDAEVATGTDTARVPSVATLKSHQGMAKAWVNFNGIGTVAIRDSYNVTSITDNGVGDYTVNLGITMANANYCASGASGTDGSGNNRNLAIASLATTSLNVWATGTTTQKLDADPICVHIFGD
ncbi:hypothetical protein CO731_00825 [Aminobacter sp. MSH1]|uniref:hypothetical protein n=1 Tax=Aminobacter sp. MSH1 TaxID=374606 RepID=UPI000D37561D|nr:hypothetical protein [Aminobacter sp. MSH1]AWC21374.1 hypothetical protein CO731_00825 [Aminobacter sp. MSH1]